MSPMSKVEAELECMIGSIRWFAKDHKLTAEQVRGIWDAGTPAVTVRIIGIYFREEQM